MTNKTALLENLSALYSVHGGIKSIRQSAYFWLAVGLTILSWRFAFENPNVWTTTNITIGPALTGFSIASFAVMFAIMDEKTRMLLMARDASDTTKSPILELFSIVTHTILIQILSLVFAVIYTAKPFPIFPHFVEIAQWTNSICALFGILLFYYGLSLVISVALAIFKLFELIANSQPVRKSK
jgi:hypothetical protein